MLIVSHFGKWHFTDGLMVRFRAKQLSFRIPKSFLNANLKLQPTYTSIQNYTCNFLPFGCCFWFCPAYERQN